MKYKLIVLVVLGLFSIICAIGNWDWYMTHRKARFFVNIIGRNGTRIFYVLLGLALICVAFYVANDEGIFAQLKADGWFPGLAED